MRTKSFVWDSRRNGWKPEGMPKNYYPGSGFLAAHDTIEHFNDKPDFLHELRAFGSTVFIRMYAYDDPGEVEAAIDVAAEDLAQFLFRDQDVKVAAPPKRWMKPLPDRKAERTVLAMMDAAEVKLRMLEMGNIFFGDWPAGMLPNLADVKRCLQHCAGWIRLGWRVAQRRYLGHTPHDVLKVFQSLEKMINIDHDEHMPKAGDRLTVHFDPRALTVNIERGRVKRVRKPKTATVQPQE